MCIEGACVAGWSCRAVRHASEATVVARGRPKTPRDLAGENREVVERFTRRRTTSQGLTVRAKILLESVTGAINRGGRRTRLHPTDGG
jgi:hypothetical protein